MSRYSAMSRQQMEQEYDRLHTLLDACKEQKLNLNMARGKPAKMQLDAVSDILQVLTNSDECFDDGIDIRNYGELCGIPSARAYWADVLDCKPEQTFIGGSASLNLMFDVIRFFSQQKTNGQLIFTTHLTKLLNQQDLIRPDEAWICEKSDGFTKMYSFPSRCLFMLALTKISDVACFMRSKDVLKEAIREFDGTVIWYHTTVNFLMDW